MVGVPIWIPLCHSEKGGLRRTRAGVLDRMTLSDESRAHIHVSQEPPSSRVERKVEVTAYTGRLRAIPMLEACVKPVKVCARCERDANLGTARQNRLSCSSTGIGAYRL